ncbi:hypothetical protein [uncultured Tateyamaria sp.]|uniref:hypothetical protein n=1 Tax=uncultured Tateyamaria sp. TaxID=455651 RepID=UPI00262F9CEA|nr:hypothetical protein [uncultured Tateyamaria sp.]
MPRAPAIVFAIIALLPSAVAADMRTATKRAKSGDFDATTQVRCAQEVGEPLGSCDAAAAQSERSAAVVVTFQNGFARTLMFSDGAFIRGNATMSGSGTDMDWTLSDQTYSIRVDDQRFEIPEALVDGE